MTAPVAGWPVGLPQALLVAGYSDQGQENSIRFRPEVGDAKVRRRGTSAGRMISGSLVINQNKRQILDQFYESTLSHGSATFLWRDAGKGAGIFAFDAPPRYSLVSPGNWRVDLQFLRYA